MAEIDWEYIAGRNQASRKYHKERRKIAEAEVARLSEENEQLRQQNADMAAWINAQQEGV